MCPVGGVSLIGLKDTVHKFLSSRSVLPSDYHVMFDHMFEWFLNRLMLDISVQNFSGFEVEHINHYILKTG